MTIGLKKGKLFYKKVETKTIDLSNRKMNFNKKKLKKIIKKE